MTPLFRVITDEDWRREITRARIQPNVVRSRIRAAIIHRHTTRPSGSPAPALTLTNYEARHQNLP